jgi:hypothetical protein
MQSKYLVLLILLIVASVMINVSLAFGLNGPNHLPGSNTKTDSGSHLKGLSDTKFNLCLCCKGDPVQKKLPVCDQALKSKSECNKDEYEGHCC